MILTFIFAVLTLTYSPPSHSQGVNHGQERGGGSGLAAEIQSAGDLFIGFILPLTDVDSPQLKSLQEADHEILVIERPVLSCDQKRFLIGYSHPRSGISVYQATLWRRLSLNEKIKIGGQLQVQAQGIDLPKSVKDQVQDLLPEPTSTAQCPYDIAFCQDVKDIEVHLLSVYLQVARGELPLIDAKKTYNESVLKLERLRMQFLKKQNPANGLPTQSQELNLSIKTYLSHQFLPLSDWLQADLDRPVKPPHCLEGGE